MATASSARNLVTGSGTVATTNGSRLLVFSQAQSFKAGETVLIPTVPAKYFTIDAGSGTNWVTHQVAVGTGSGMTFKRTDPSTSRARGAGEIIPDAVHYTYRAQLDAAGAADWYLYFDTVAPEKGRHPYTKDVYTGGAAVSSASKQAMVPDLVTRIRVLEGTLRVNTAPGDTTNPDRRLDAIEARLNALDGQGAPSYTLQQLLDAGDTV